MSQTNKKFYDGVLFMKNIQLRDYQEAIINKAVEVLENGRNVVINAPTGTGKTIMTLEILRRLELTGWIYVRTISQYSSWERDARKLGLSFSGLMRKGEFCKVMKKPYILYCTYCDDEVDEDDSEHRREHKKFIERRYLNPVCSDCMYNPKSKSFGSPEEVEEVVDPVVTKMKELLMEEGIKYTGNWFRDDKKYNVCVYKLIEFPSWIRIYSYIYFFLNIRRPKDKSMDDVVVFDESHNLDDFNVISVTLTRNEVLGFFERIKTDEFGKERLLREVRTDFDNFIDDPERGFSRLQDIEQVDETLARKFYTIIRAWKEERDRWYFERNKEEGYIKAMPSDPALWLSQLNNYRFILLSGTMPSADYLRTVWGINNFEYINAMSFYNTTSLKNHFAGSQIFVDDSIYYIKQNRASLRKKVIEIIKQYSRKDGLNLVIVPSYDDMEVYRFMMSNAFFEDFRPDVLERVKNLPDGSVVFGVAGGKLSEGIEVTDRNGRSRIKTVFIVGLPIPEYRNPYIERMIEVVSKRVNKDPKSFKWVILYEKAVIKVRQALGRAIRSPQDTAVIYLLDKRFTYKNVEEKMGLEVME